MQLLIGTLRKKFPDLPIHLHTHDTAGTGVATVLAAFEAGADIADTAIDSFSGMTSQPSMGAVVHALNDSPLQTGIDTVQLAELNDYWCDTRMIYAPFESNLKSGSADVYYHEMPGGQYTNLLFQSCCLGLEVISPPFSLSLSHTLLLFITIIFRVNGPQSSERTVTPISCSVIFQRSLHRVRYCQRI
jgi:pyruvate carboxylase